MVAIRAPGCLVGGMHVVGGDGADGSEVCVPSGGEAGGRVVGAQQGGCERGARVHAEVGHVQDRAHPLGESMHVMCGVD